MLDLEFDADRRKFAKFQVINKPVNKSKPDNNASKCIIVYFVLSNQLQFGQNGF